MYVHYGINLFHSERNKCNFVEMQNLARPLRLYTCSVLFLCNASKTVSEVPGRKEIHIP